MCKSRYHILEENALTLWLYFADLWILHSNLENDTRIINRNQFIYRTIYCLSQVQHTSKFQWKKKRECKFDVQLGLRETAANVVVDLMTHIWVRKFTAKLNIFGAASNFYYKNLSLLIKTSVERGHCSQNGINPKTSKLADGRTKLRVKFAYYPAHEGTSFGDKLLCEGKFPL